MMRALTIWQPWASLIVAGAKPYEFRSWPAPRTVVGQRIAIHAGKRIVQPSEMEMLLRSLRAGSSRQALVAELAVPIIEAALRDPGNLPRSSVIGFATLGEPLSPSGVHARFANDSDRDAHFNWGWPMLQPERLEPFVPARGAQGFWPWAPETQSAARPRTTIDPRELPY